MLIDKDVPMTTRDGVTLRADVYRPDAPGRFPVLLSRLPYDKNLRRRPGDIDVFVERGYVVIFQDTRSRFASDGDEYYPLAWEAQEMLRERPTSQRRRWPFLIDLLVYCL